LPGSIENNQASGPHERCRHRTDEWLPDSIVTVEDPEMDAAIDGPNTIVFEDMRELAGLLEQCRAK
jgi:hypothetical protein